MGTTMTRRSSILNFAYSMVTDHSFPKIEQGLWNGDWAGPIQGMHLYQFESAVELPQPVTGSSMLIKSRSGRTQLTRMNHFGSLLIAPATGFS
jgi:hypothetical protein